MAIRAVEQGQEKNAASASEAFDVDKRTLYRRVSGSAVSRSMAHEGQQRLTGPEEKAVVKWCFDQDDRGFPPKLSMVRDMGLHLERKRLGKVSDAFGKNWMSRFLKRHPNLAVKLSTQLERQRAYAKDPRLIQDYFAKLSGVIRQYGLKADQIFNMDEKGFVMGLAARAKVLCRRGRRNPHVTHDGKRELITVIEMICGNGSVLSPFIINKGAGHYLGWYSNLSEENKDYQFSYSAKGWTDDKLALEWLEKVFEPESGVICSGQPRLLVFDGHGSHITYQFVSYCLSHNILLLCLPSHSTHLLQPLDVGLFSPYQHYYGIEVDNYVRSGKNIVGIKKSVFLPFLTAARNQTFSPHNILQSFISTGIWPLNARRVLGKITPTTTKRRDTLGTMPIPKSSREIRQRVLSATKLVDTLSSQSTSLSTIDRVKSIMKDLGHQLEEEIAEKEIWQELTHKLQKVDLIHNTTDKRKLSEARVLDGAALIQLRDARLEKDTKKAVAGLARKLASGASRSSRMVSLLAANVRRTDSP